MLPSSIEDWLRIIYVVFSFFAALCLGAIKSMSFLSSFMFNNIGACSGLPLILKVLERPGYLTLSCLFLMHVSSYMFFLRMFILCICYVIYSGVLVGPIAALILIFGNVGVILGLLPSHVYWTFYTLIK